MDCPECDKPLDISATKPNHLCCRSCRLLFIVKPDDTILPLAIKAPEDMDEDEFFASFCRNLGFEDDSEEDSSAALRADERSGGSGVRRVLLGIVVIVAACLLYWWTHRG